jgi:DNA-binding transcriptional LysR family regulator
LKANFKINELQALTVFATVVQQGSMSAAARVLGSTPSAVSQRVRALESAHGVRLLHRSTRRLATTDAGEQLLEHAVALQQAARGARAALERARDALEGELRISAPVGFARHVAPALAPLLAAHPTLRLHLEVDDAMIDLIANRIDLALRAGTMPDSAWVARRLGAFEWVLTAAPDYLARHGVPQHPRELDRHHWLSVREGALKLALRGPGDERFDLAVRPRITSNNQLTLQQLCLAGLGLAMQVQPDATQELRTGRLVPLLPLWRLEPIPVWAVTTRRAEAQPAKVRQAIVALSAWLRGRPGVAA